MLVTDLSESLFRPTSVGTQPCSGTYETFSREEFPKIAEGIYSQQIDNYFS